MIVALRLPHVTEGSRSATTTVRKRASRARTLPGAWVSSETSATATCPQVPMGAVARYARVDSETRENLLRAHTLSLHPALFSHLFLPHRPEERQEFCYKAHATWRGHAAARRTISSVVVRTTKRGSEEKKKERERKSEKIRKLARRRRLRG